MCSKEKIHNCMQPKNTLYSFAQLEINKKAQPGSSWSSNKLVSKQDKTPAENHLRDNEHERVTAR